MMTHFDKALKPDDKEGQRLKKNIENKWKKRGSLGGADKNDKLIFTGDETIGVSLIILDYQEKEKVIREVLKQI